MEVGLESVSVFYGEGNTRFQALCHASLRIYPGKITVVMGPSGSGKSTMLAALGLLRRPDSGRVLLPGNPPMETIGERSRLRLQSVGFVFQNANLISSCTALQNVQIPGQLLGTDPKILTARARQLMEEFGVAPRAQHKPHQLSGGEIQRIAICRALINRPVVLLADEPTASLDSAMGLRIAKHFRNVADQRDTAILLVTHDYRLAEFADSLLEMRDGRIV